jgi:hypothetical protein
MSTNFLNRRMDLSHYILDNYNILEMDTSYPVKLAGKVIKLFNATADFDPDKGYKLFNSDKELMLDIITDNVYDFAGRVIKNNVGDDCVYPLATDVYKENDYVMALIDFDASKILLCSQTNFESMVGAGEGRVRIFTLDGNKEPTEYDIGIEYPYDEDVFDNAAKFESMDGRDALAKFTTDQVLYETPASEWYDSHRKDRTMIPVAKTEVTNIGSKLTARLNKFMFAYLDNLGGDFGVSYVNKIAAFVQIYGSLNSTFVDDFCMTESEMLKSNLIATATSKMKKSILEEYNNIPDSYKNKYRYILMCNTENTDNSNETDDFSINNYDASLKFIPFDVDNGVFPSLFMLNNRGFVVDGESVELPAYLSNNYNDYLGQLEYDDARQGYSVYHYDTKIDILLPKYYQAISSSAGGTDDLEDFPISECTITTGNIPVLYTSPNDDTPMTGIRKDGTLNKDNFSAYLAPINKFMNFFMPLSYRQTIGGIDNNIYNSILAFQNSTNALTHCYTVMGSDKLANTVVIEYPTMFEELIEAGTSDITNYNITIDDTVFNRKNLTFDNRVSPNNYDHLEGLVFKLFNTTNTNAYMESINGGKCANMTYKYDDESLDPIEFANQYSYVSTRSLSKNVDGNYRYNEGVFVSGDNSFVFVPISIVSMNALGVKNGAEIDYNPAEVTANNIIVIKKIKRALDKYPGTNIPYISYQDIGFGTPYLCYYNGKDYLPLYMVSKVEDGDTYAPDTVSLTLNNETFIIHHIEENDTSIAAGFKMPYTAWKGDYLYLYYIGTNGLHRLKYHYSTMGAVRNITDFDYFTDNLVYDSILCGSGLFGYKWDNPRDITVYDLDDLERMDKSTSYLKAYINAKAKENYNRNTLNAIRNSSAAEISYDSLSLILYVDAYYGLYTSVNENPSATYGKDNTLIQASSKYLSLTSNYNLTVGIDEIIVFPGTNNNNNIYGVRGIRMSDMFKTNNVTIPKNMMTPIISDKVDVNGGYIYNIGTYLSKASNAKNDAIGGWTLNGINRTINTNGIKEKDYYYTGDRNLLNFYKYALSHDLDRTTENKYFDTAENYDRILIKKAKILDGLKFMPNEYPSDLYKNTTWDFYDINNNKVTLSAANKDGIVLHTNLDPKNIMGISEVTLNKADGTDCSSDYVDESVLSYVNIVTTGKKTTYSLSLNDTDDALEHNMIAIDGSSDTVPADEISAQTMLKAISGNKSIDILSYSLRTIKTILNTDIIDAIQNISDTITMQENKTTVETANRTDPHPHAGDSNMQPYLIPNGSTWADFNSDLCLYNFHFAYGYLSPQGHSSIYNEHRIVNNRGVIVFVTENGDSYRQAGSGGVYNVYSNRVPDIRPKRMYINNDGLLCTKEYFDREETVFNNNPYPQATSLAELRNSINNLLTRVNDLTNRVEAIEQELQSEEEQEP